MNHVGQHAFEQPGQGNVVTQFLPNESLKLRRSKKDDLSEMPGFLSGGLTVIICGETSMLSTSITRKMFVLCMFADFIWRNGPETL